MPARGLLELGARPADIGQTGTASWHVLADPEGNEFCLLRARLSRASARTGKRRNHTLRARSTGCR